MTVGELIKLLEKCPDKKMKVITKSTLQKPPVGDKLIVFRDVVYVNTHPERIEIVG